MNKGNTRVLRMAATALLMVLTLNAPARAEGLFDWLWGDEPDVPASMEVTLPPAEAIQPTTQPVAEPTAAPTPEPTATPMPIPDAAIEDDGMVRVLLRSLDAPKQLHLTLSGIYSVESDPGFRFERDTRVTLSASGGSIYLAVGGLTLKMGGAMTLTRHRAKDGAENGIYIDESEKESLYCGDLAVSVVGEDALRAVLRIHVEDYLLGVVAYEMSDSFPLEALKAQAVAARTYALRRKWQSGSRDYDLVDTTADQVYKGYIAEYVNVTRAVEETRGVVGLWNGGFASCYYTASNGGQTALPGQVFGTVEDDAYLAVVDDPYDLENPRSLLNELTFTARCEGSAKLREMLENALGEKLAAEGFGEDEWELDSIASVEPVKPRFEGSRMYEKLAFSLRVKLLMPALTPIPEPTGTPEPTEAATADETAQSDTVNALAAALSGEATPDATLESTPEPTVVPELTEAPREWRLSDTPYTVTLGVYDQVKDGLKLGLNGTDCELISVQTRTDDSGLPQSFTLVMRRYGHGVGMSQRGAQWMAGTYDKSWQEIVAFYYPGLSFERMSWPGDGLTDLDALPTGVGAARPKPTPTPTPAPLPQLEAGERYAEVLATSLNVRERPTTASRALDQLSKGRRVIVSGEVDADGWVSVRTAELKGFVKAEYLNIQ